MKLLGSGHADGKSSVYTLFGWLALCYAAAFFGSQFSPSSAGTDVWYASLNKPSWNPPGWVFGPVWGTLYTLMGVAAWLVWKAGKSTSSGGATSGAHQARGRTALPLTLFVLQLCANALWSFFFFGLRNPGLAFADICVLQLAIALTIWSFWKVNRLAGMLMLPYIAWVTFASVLNFTLLRMNG
ncbi:MAG TPA: TspO/MBR family protein [Abditibacteriaceae bacterium]|jgi:tryptophan-rich sensory protein